MPSCNNKPFSDRCLGASHAREAAHERCGKLKGRPEAALDVKGSAILGSAADTSSAGMTVIPDPLHDRSAQREPVTIGLAIHPVRPLLEELVVGHPPFAGVGRTIATREARGHRVHLAGHMSVGGVADR